MTLCGAGEEARGDWEGLGPQRDQGTHDAFADRRQQQSGSGGRAENRRRKCGGGAGGDLVIGAYSDGTAGIQT